MLINMNEQVSVILFSVISGVILGILYCIYRSYIYIIDIPSQLLNNVLDIIFFMFVALELYIFLLKTNGGYVNLYVLLYMFSGYYIFKLLIYRRIFDINIRINKLLLNLLKFLFNSLFNSVQILEKKGKHH